MSSMLIDCMPCVSFAGFIQIVDHRLKKYLYFPENDRENPEKNTWIHFTFIISILFTYLYYLLHLYDTSSWKLWVAKNEDQYKIKSNRFTSTSNKNKMDIKIINCKYAKSHTGQIPTFIYNMSYSCAGWNK